MLYVVNDRIIFEIPVPLPTQGFRFWLKWRGLNSRPLGSETMTLALRLV